MDDIAQPAGGGRYGKMWYEGADSSGRVRLHYAEVTEEIFRQRCYDTVA